MGIKALQERRERLGHIVLMLNALSGMSARDGSASLHYFIDLAAAQARSDHAPS